VRYQIPKHLVIWQSEFFHIEITVTLTATQRTGTLTATPFFMVLMLTFQFFSRHQPAVQFNFKGLGIILWIERIFLHPHFRGS
jgi:hypothetical protein